MAAHRRFVAACLAVLVVVVGVVQEVRAETVNVGVSGRVDRQHAHTREHAASSPPGSDAVPEPAQAAPAKTSLRASRAGAPEKLNVFILPHSHDDVGWVQTPTEYYDNFVYDIYTSVTAEMELNPKRKFQCVEQYYFERWWLDATPAQREAVHRFVKEGRFEFVVGGWSMPDEATTDYPSLIECMTVGHEFIYDTFGVVPRYGFQVDPFGASSAFAYYSALMGFDAHIIDRIDWWTKADMQATQSLEFMWQPATIAPTTKIFTHVMDQFAYSVPFIPAKIQLQYLCAVHNSTDCPGGNYLWDGDDGHPAAYWQYHPVYPGVNSSNVEFYSTYLVNNTKLRSQWFRTNNLLWPFGSDFQHFNATRMFGGMDQIIDYVNARNGPGEMYDGITLQYAVLSEYFDAIHADNLQWGSRGPEDFLPYTSDNHVLGDQYSPKTWTGYYSSHSQLKGHARANAAFLRVADQLYSLAQMHGKAFTAEQWEGLYALRKVVGILQHHDAVTGTEGPGTTPFQTPGQIGNIVQRYTELLNDSRASAETVAQDSLSYLLRQSTPGFNEFSEPTFLDEDDAAAKLHARVPVPVVVYNPLGWRRTRWVQVPVPTANVGVATADGTPVPSQVTPTAPMTGVCRDMPGACSAVENGNPTYEKQPYLLHFQAKDMPALGTASFVLVPTGPPEATGAGGGAAASAKLPEAVAAGAPLTIANPHLALEFDTTTGLLKTVKSCITDATAHDASALCGEPGAAPHGDYPVSQQLMVYESFGNATAGSVSGSYIFHPKGPATATPGAPTLSVLRGSFVTEVWQHWGEGLDSVVRLINDPDPAVAGVFEVDHGIGPLPGNHEVITRLQSSLATEEAAGASTNPVWYGDSNGHFLIKRVTNTSVGPHMPDASYQISANYRPMVRRAQLQDAGVGVTLTAMSSRTHGAASLASGQLEIMLHRRELQDDGLGACFHPNQSGPFKRADGCPANRIPLNVTSRVYPRLRFTVGAADQVAALSQLQVQALNNPAAVFFAAPGADSQSAATTWLAQYGRTPLAPLARTLDDSVHLLTLQPRSRPGGASVVVRLQNLDEGASDSAATVDLEGLFGVGEPMSLDERSLSVVWSLADLTRVSWDSDASDEAQGAPAPLDPSRISLAPGQIRTFQAAYANAPPSPGPPPFRGETAWVVTVAIVAVVLVLSIGYYHHRQRSGTKKRARSVNGDVSASALLGRPQ